jgi:hypothetical protein
MRCIKNIVITLILFIFYVIFMLISLLILIIGYIPCLIIDALETHNRHKHMKRLYREADIIIKEGQKRDLHQRS